MSLPSDQDTADSRYQPGQIWRYKTRDQEPDSTLAVLKVESYPNLGNVVHVAVERVQFTSVQGPEGSLHRIPHLPFGEGAVDTSVTELVGHTDMLPPFTAEYLDWRQSFDAEEAGVFIIQVKEAVEFIEQVLSQE